MKKYAVIIFILLGVQFFSMPAFAQSINVDIAIDQDFPSAASNQSDMRFTISFSGPTEEETKNAAITVSIKDSSGNALDVALMKTEDQTVTDPSEGLLNERTCTYTGLVPAGAKYTVYVVVQIEDQEISQSREFDVYPMRRVSGTIQLPENQIAANPIECRVLLLDREEIESEQVVDCVPTDITAIIPRGENKVDYQFDYFSSAYPEPVIIDCRIAGDNGYTEDNFYTESATTPYWYSASQMDVSEQDSTGMDFTLVKAEQINGTFTLPEEPERATPTLTVTMQAHSDMGTQDKNDDITIEKKFNFNYGESNDYTLSVPYGSSDYIVSYRLTSYYNSYPSVTDGIPASGYYNNMGIAQLKVYAERISLISGDANGIDFTPVPYNYSGLSDITDHWANCYIYEMVARGIFSPKGSENTFQPDDDATRGECVDAVIKLFGLDNTDAVQVFGDVTPDSPYFQSVSTAYRLGLINGYPDGTFNPDALITRQDAELILYRGMMDYFKLAPDTIKGFKVRDSSFISDKEDISPYAYDAVSFCFEYYINMFKNTDYCSNPRENMPRCILASEFYRCLKFIDGNL